VLLRSSTDEIERTWATPRSSADFARSDAALRNNVAMSSQPRAPGEVDRRQFIGDSDVLAALGVTVDELVDPDVRSLVIRYEHPEFEDALKRGLDEIDVGDRPMNPRLHRDARDCRDATLGGLAAGGVGDDGAAGRRGVRAARDPAHAQSARRGPGLGALHDKQPYDRERHVAALRSLPGSSEQERPTPKQTKRHNDAGKQARRNPQVTRRRNRRPS
jgi:hypothetical protein